MSDWYEDSRGETIPLIRIGKVVDNSDPKGTGRLLVRIDGTDKLDSDEDLVPCFPLIPKFLNVYPEVNEAVFIFQYEYRVGLKTASKTKRYWIGPIVSQLQNLEREDYKTALTQEPDGYTHPGPNINNIKSAKGAYPDKKDIGLQGRDNADILLKTREVQIRAGKFSITDNTKFNKKDPAYIQLKYGNSELKKEFVNKTFKKKVFSAPTHTIKVVVNSFLPDGTALPNDLSSEEYATANRHIVSLIVRDIQEGNDVYSFNNGGLDYNTRGAAIKGLIDEVDGQIEEYTKWKILTPTSELLEKYGQEGQLSKLNKVVLYPNNTTERTETKKILKLKKSTASKDGSVVNVVASKINFISHDGEHDFDITDPEELITTETQNRINSEAHPIVYGDKLVEFLELVKDYVNNHTHPYHQDVAVDSPDKTNALDYDLTTILNKNINSN